MPESDVTLGELARRLNAMDVNVARRLDSIEHRIEQLEYVPRSVYTVEMTSMARRIDELEDAKKWLARAVVTALTLPVLVAVIIALVVQRG